MPAALSRNGADYSETQASTEDHGLSHFSGGTGRMDRDHTPHRRPVLLGNSVEEAGTVVPSIPHRSLYCH